MIYKPALYLVMFKDVPDMNPGKAVAQGAHASMKVFLDYMERIVVEDSPKNIIVKRLKYLEDSPELDWLEGIFTKICVSVKSEQELIDIYEQAKNAKIPCALIEDRGHTEFHNVPTKTCCAIGPWLADEIDQITGHLPLL